MINLNSEQKRAVEIVDRPLIVIAGPGTGKTTLITEKINFLLNNRFKQEEILAITFTKKAAEEMSNRVGKNFKAMTFHSFAQEIIEDYQKNIPQIDKDFILIEENIQKIFFLENIEKFKFNSVEIKNNYNLIASELQSQISKLKDFGYSLKDLEKIECEDLQLKLDIFSAYSKYELYKKNNNFVDFGDLLLLVLDLLKSNSKVLSEIKEKYKYILVDEFQDTNLVQLEIIKLIAEENITIVGDQKQSIYGFRGSNFANLSNFKSHFKNYEEVFLNENYRCSNEVLTQINKITSDLGLKDEILNSNSSEKGLTKLIGSQTEKSQNTFLIQNISKILEKEKDVKIGILFRRKSELKKVSSYLNSFGIKHLAIGSENFLQNGLVKEVLRILQIIEKPKESNSQLFALFKYFNLRDESIKKIFRQSKLKEKPIFILLKKDLDSLVSFEDEKNTLSLIGNLLNEFVNFYNSKLNLKSLVQKILFKFNFYQISLSSNNVEAVFSLGKLLNFVGNYVDIYKDSSLSNFLKVCDYSKNIECDTNEEISSNVELLTIHNSKGKEFDYVFIPYLNERRFPTSFKTSKFDILGIENKLSFIDEEKRLFFVGLSRAKKSLFLSYVKKFEGNKLNSKKSQFLEILDLEEESFNQEYDEFDLEQSEKIKLEIIDKINKNLFSGNYKKAQDEMNLLESLFKREDNGEVGLNKFLLDEHPDFKFYKKKLSDSNYLNIEIKPSSMVYSVSQLKTYESCPKKYLYSYIYKIPTEPKHFFDFGTSVHGVFEEIVKLIRKLPKEAVFANAVSFLRKTWISKGYVSASQEREYFEKGVQSIKMFIDREIELKEDKFRRLESQEEKFFINLEGRRIMGFIDRIDKVDEDDFEILDYKTSNSMMTKSQLKEDLQLFVYGLACKELKGKFPKNVGLWYVIHNKISLLNFAELDIEKLKEKAISLMQGIEKKDFKANPSFFACKYCDYSKICDNSLE